jgi:hypothetical protein
MKKFFIPVFSLVALFIGENAFACTSAIVSAARSTEGHTLLWKHRDSPSWDCHIAHIKGGRYAYTALVSPDKKMVYSGINERGFAILNTVSENITKQKNLCQAPGALFIMAFALGPTISWMQNNVIAKFWKE